MTVAPAPPRRVGHKGAAALVPGNTRESFEAALGLGVDMIEFDVLRLPDGRIVVAHDEGEATERESLGLEEALDLFAADAYADVELDVDLKNAGYEDEVVAALAARGLVERSLVASNYRASLDRIGELEPGLRRGWSVPRASRDYTAMALVAAPARGVVLGMRAWLPGAAARAVREGRCEALMAHTGLVSRRLVAAVHAEGGLLFVWTVDDARRIATLTALGVDGIITNDPRLWNDDAGS